MFDDHFGGLKFKKSFLEAMCKVQDIGIVLILTALSFYNLHYLLCGPFFFSSFYKALLSNLLSSATMLCTLT